MPFGKQKDKEGICVGFTEHPQVEKKKLKEVKAVIDDEALVNAELLELSQWVAEYYFAGRGEVLFSMIPAAVRRKAEARLKQVMDEQTIILDNIAVGVLFAVHRKILWANNSLTRILGYNAREMVGSDTEIFYPDKKSYMKIDREGYAALAHGEVYAVEIPMKKRDGSLLWCHLVGQAVNSTGRRSPENTTRSRSAYGPHEKGYVTWRSK